MKGLFISPRAVQRCTLLLPYLQSTGFLKPSVPRPASVVSYINGSHSQDSSNRPTDDAERGALGAEGVIVYHAMRAHRGRISCKELVEVTRLTRGQVYYCLRRLRECKLVNLEGRQWVVLREATADELDERVARPAGTLGKGARRHRRAVKEREAYALERVLSSPALRESRSQIPPAGR